MDAMLRRRLLEGLGEGKRFEGHVQRLAAFLDLTPARVRAAIRDLATRRDWIELAPGIVSFWLSPGPRRSTATCHLIRVAAGLGFEIADDEDESWLFVLSGVGRAGSRVWLPGDLLLLEMGQYSIVAAGTHPLIFVRLSFPRSDADPDRTDPLRAA